MTPTPSSARFLALVTILPTLLSSTLGCGGEPSGPAPSASAAPSEPTPPPAGDEIGMARELGPDAWARCGEHLVGAGAKVYELSYIRSNTMPLSPFAGPYEITYLPTNGLPGLSQVFNDDVLNENVNVGQQGTQMDALGHFARIDEVWDGTSELPIGSAVYYGGYTQAEVKPTPDSPLLKLGMEKAPPIITSAILLDAKTYIKGGEPMEAGEQITPEQIVQMLEAQGLAERGILPGDVVYIYTGWSDHFQDPDVEQVYYSMSPGLSYEAAKYLGERRVVAVGLDVPFLDAVAEGQLAGTAAPPEGTPPGKAFAVHEYFLTEAGVHHLESVKLDELAADGVTVSCTIILPLRRKGSASSPIRPVAIGAPRR